MWYLENGRNLPWRNTRDPYPIWLSEIILQQTRVEQGLPYYESFISTFPTVKQLALASEEQVFKLWQGLGYYSRARNLHATARFVHFECADVFPDNYKDLLALKGVGDYTASAISSICFDEVQAVVDGNVYRVLSRVFGIDTPIDTSRGKKEFRELAQYLIDPDQPGTFNQAIMEFGARHCVPRNPDCSSCIFQDRCVAYRSNQIEKLPVKKGKTKSKKVYHQYLVLTSSDGKTMLERRDGKGIWSGLYQFPVLETEEPYKVDQQLPHELLEPYREQYGLRSVNLYNDQPVVHILSHRKIHANFWILETDELGDQGVDFDAINTFPVPVLMDRFIRSFPGFKD